MIEKNMASSIDEAEKLILSGRIISQDRKYSSAHEKVSEELEIRLKGESRPYVSRGGEKIASVYELFEISLSDKQGLDCGASSGGFTDFFLQKGVRSMVTIDVNYGQLDHKLRISPNVLEIERTNLRNLTTDEMSKLIGKHKKNIHHSFNFPVDFLIADLSFISLKTVFATIEPWVSPKGYYILLFKPQFELPRIHIPKGGVVTNTEETLKCLESFCTFCSRFAKLIKTIPSQILGQNGNQEFFILLQRNS